MSRKYMYLALFAAAVALTSVRAESSSSTGGKSVTFVFVGGYILPVGPFADPLYGVPSQQIQSVQAELQAAFPGYNVSIAIYSYDGNNLSTGSTLMQDVRSNPNLLNFSACFSAGCGELQQVADSLENVVDEPIQELIAIDPYNLPTLSRPIPLPLQMTLDVSTDIRLIISKNPALLPSTPAPPQAAFFPNSGTVFSVSSVPGNHDNVLREAVASGVATQQFAQIVLSTGAPK